MTKDISSATGKPVSVGSDTAGDGWEPMSSAPKDGTWIQARIPGYGSDNVIFWMTGLLDSDGADCGGWSFAAEQEPPDCWTDGICWEVNEDEIASARPTCWKPLAPAAHPDKS